MSDMRPFNQWIASHGVSLADLGVAECALRRDDALRAVDLLGVSGDAILGGDVYVAQGETLQSAYANWHVDRLEGESKGQFSVRSCRDARLYISQYPEPYEGVPLFVFVVSD